MHPPVHLCFSSPQLRPTSKRMDNASTYSPLRERHTSLHARLLSRSHTNTHTHIQQTHILTIHPPTLPQCSQTFMSVGLYIFPTLDVQSAVSSSVAADRVSLRCSQAHQAFCFHSVWFHFVFCVMSFLVFWAANCSKRQPQRKACVWIVQGEQEGEVTYRQSNLVSPGHLCYFV